MFSRRGVPKVPLGADIRVDAEVDVEEPDNNVQVAEVVLHSSSKTKNSSDICIKACR